MRTSFVVLPLLLALGACSGADDPQRVTSSLECVPAGGGTAVPCTLTLEEAGGFRITLVSRDCVALETVVSITAPAAVAGDVIENACSAEPGSSWTFDDNGAPFAAGTQINMVFTSDQFASPPGIRVTGDYPQWTVNFEDGFDEDFNDVILTVTALPAS